MAAPPRDTQDVLISFLATAIAATALFVSLLQSYYSQRHYRLSTQPLLNIGSAAKRIDSQAAGDTEEDITLRNKGLGPARVKAIGILVDGKPLAAPAGVQANDFFAIEAIVDQLVASGVIRAGQVEMPEPGDFIKENDQLAILSVKTSDVLKRPDWLAFLDKRIGVRIEYCSIYDQCQTVCYQPSQARTANC